MVQENTPDGLHRMQYAVHILESELCWPSKGNAELLADCILSLSKGKHLSLKQAHDYLVRAIRLAREQCIVIDRMFFMNGDYTSVRPVVKEKQWKPADRTELDKHQATEGWQTAAAELREKLSNLAKVKAI